MQILQIICKIIYNSWMIVNDIDINGNKWNLDITLSNYIIN